VVVIRGGNVAYGVARTVVRQAAYDAARTAARMVGGRDEQGTEDHRLRRSLERGDLSKEVRRLTIRTMKPRAAEGVARSKITSKAQTVVPRVIRERLGLRPGDTLRYRIVREGVLIDRWPSSGDDPFSEFTEWSGAEDEAAFEDL
jgi:antitoxin PrlF